MGLSNQIESLTTPCGHFGDALFCGCFLFTVDVRLLVQLGDAQQVGALLLAADPGLAPRQRGLEVELVAAVRQRVRVPEGLAAAAWRSTERADVKPHDQQGRR